MRAEAQLQLTQMHCYTNPTQIRNRCLLGGKGRGIFRDFKMSRVSQTLPGVKTEAGPGEGLLGRDCSTADVPLQYNFRLQALAGALPGVQKASW